MKNILKRECNKVTMYHKLNFTYFVLILILTLRLIFLINFLAKKFSKIKSNTENVLVLYHKLHNFYQSPHFFLMKLFKIEGLILRIYCSSHWKCSGEKMLLEIAVAIFKSFLRITLKLLCESVAKTPENIYVKKFRFSKFAGFQRVTRLTMNYFTNIYQGF